MPTAPDTNKTRDDVSIMEMPFSGEYAATVEAKQTTLGKTSTRARNSVTALTIARSDHEPDQDGYTGRDNDGGETDDDDVPWENHECYDTIEGETVSHAEPIVPDSSRLRNQIRGRH